MAMNLSEYLRLKIEAEELRQKLGQEVRQLRSANSVTQVQLAKAIDVTQAYVSQVESGTRTPSEEKVESIINYFKEVSTSGTDQDKA